MVKASGSDPGPSPLFSLQQVFSASVRLISLILFPIGLLCGCGGTTVESPVPAETTTTISSTSSSSGPSETMTDSEQQPQATSTTAANSAFVSVPTTAPELGGPTTTIASTEPPTSTTVTTTTLPKIDYDAPTPGFESEEPNDNNQFITYEPNT